MMDLASRLPDVFSVADVQLSGTPLCVFEDGRGLQPERMQALARQMNLSETALVLPPRRAVAQGAQVGPPSRLLLEVDAAGLVRVTGGVVELGRGTIRLRGGPRGRPPGDEA